MFDNLMLSQRELEVIVWAVGMFFVLIGACLIFLLTVTDTDTDTDTDED